MNEFEAVVWLVQHKKEQLINRLSRWVEQTEGPLSTPCQLWHGVTQHNGYGRVNFRVNKVHRYFMVHRLALILKLGRPIKKGADAAHRCHRRNCMEHLFEQPHRENCRDRSARVKT